MTEYNKIAEGQFTSTGVAEFVNLPFLPNSFEMWNITQWGTNTNNLVKYALGTAQANPATAYTTISTGAANNNVTITVGGFSFIEAGTYQFGPTIALATTFVTQAAAALVTTATAHGLSTGDAVLLYGTTGMLQIAGEIYTVTVISPTTFTIDVDSSGFAAAATAGFMKQVLYPDLYIPYRAGITGITLGATTIVQTAVNHRFVVGQEVAFVIPRVKNSQTVWGTFELDTATFNAANVVPQQAFVISIPSANEIEVNINSTGFGAFLYPTSALAASGMTFPQVVPIGDYNFGPTGPPPFTPPITIPGAFVANTRQGVIVGIGNGTQLMHQADDVVRWRAIFPDLII